MATVTITLEDDADGSGLNFNSVCDAPMPKSAAKLTKAQVFMVAFTSSIADFGGEDVRKRFNEACEAAGSDIRL